MARLLEFFSPMFSFGLALDEQIARNDAAESVQDVQAKARSLLEQARAAALAAGKRPEQVESAAFAVVAWFDEVVTRNPAWWNHASPLQVSLFNTNNAGNEFFYHLAELKTSEDELREVYYHALLLGFVGQYYFETGDTGELGKLKELHGRQLPIAPAPVHTLREERVTPQPYLGKDPAGPRYPRQWDALLLKAGVALALLIPLGYLAWFFISPAHQNGPSVQQLVDRELRNYSCADLTAKVTLDGATTVNGYVSKPVDLERLRADVAAIPGVKTPDFDVNVRIWPHCEVIALLKSFKQRNDDLRAGLSVTPTVGHSEHFTDGEQIVFKLTQANFSGYVYVDYYDVEGNVLHLFPNAVEPGDGQPIPASTAFEVGNGKQKWFISAPFGQELITVITTPTPLYDGVRKQEVEAAKDYLPFLRKQIEARQGKTMVANYLIVQTEPKPQGQP